MKIFNLLELFVTILNIRLDTILNYMTYGAGHLVPATFVQWPKLVDEKFEIQYNQF
jgi:hypothetical protein